MSQYDLILHEILSTDDLSYQIHRIVMAWLGWELSSPEEYDELYHTNIKSYVPSIATFKIRRPNFTFNFFFIPNINYSRFMFLERKINLNKPANNKIYKHIQEI